MYSDKVRVLKCFHVLYIVQDIIAACRYGSQAGALGASAHHTIHCIHIYNIHINYY